MPRSFTIFFLFVSSYVTKFDKQLREIHLFLWGRLRVKLGRRIAAGIISEALLIGDCRFVFKPVGLLVLSFAKCAFKCVSACHAIINIVHM